MEPRDRIALGKAGEDAACRELERHGYEILARRFRTRYGEIDIIARDGPTVAFVEVKARTSSRFGEGIESVTLHKQAKIAAMAMAYVAQQRLLDVPLRFDVVGVSVGEEGRVQIELYKSAFDAARWC